MKILFLLFFLNLNMYSQEKSTSAYVPSLDKKLVVAAWKLSARISPDPQKLNYVFDKSFYNYISQDKIIEILKKLYEENGKIVNISTVSIKSENTADFFFYTDKNNIIPTTITIEENKGRIIGLFFRPSFKNSRSLTDFTSKFEQLPYKKKGLLIRRLGKLEDNIYALGEKENFAIASSFKLYILAYLIENKTKWEKVIELEDRYRSLPSGKLHLMPTGSPFTVFSLAQAMIADSDNTATDILIEYIKREKVEEYLSSFYNSSYELNKPFLKTSEMFRIKYSTQTAETYIKSNLKNKRAMLKKIANEPLDIYKIKFNMPAYIDSLEWFATPNDICMLMDYFRRKRDPYANAILSLNTGLDTKEFKYAGYKGGSEPGVMSMNWLLQAKSGTWYCVSSVVNDDKNLINESEYVSLMQDILNQVSCEVF